MSFPKYLRQLTRQIQVLLADPKVFEHCQASVCKWAQSERTKSRLEDVEVPDGHGGTLIQTYYRDTEFYLLPDQPSWEYRFAILSAVNDAVVAETKDETSVVINPFPAKLANRGRGKTKAARKTESELVVESAAYCALRSRIWELTEEDGEILRGYRSDVQHDFSDFQRYEAFIANDFQLKILDALDGVALKKRELADKVCGGEGTRLYKAGGIKELMEIGKIVNKPRLGYYRPDKPPPGNVVN